MDFAPETDGKTHINVYSRGATKLGRMLSNFARTPFEIGGVDFQSVEGWWYWKLTGDKFVALMYGSTAKARGKEIMKRQSIKREVISEADLRRVYKAKLDAYPELHAALKRCKLPLAHYYVYGDKVVVPEQWQWTAQLWDEFR